MVFARLNYIYRPGDDFYFIVNRSDEFAGKPPEYTVLAKLTFSFDF